MTFIDRRVLSQEQETELIDMGFILKFRYSYELDLNLFSVYVQE